MNAVTDTEADAGCGNHSSIPELVEALKSESLATTYSSLKWLYRKAADEDAARAIKFADGYRWIVHCGGSTNATWGLWAYANGCLWRMFASGVITEEVRDGLSVRDPTADELYELHELLKSTVRGQDERVIEALEQIRYMQSWAEDSRVSFTIAIVDLLHRASVAVLEEGTLTIQSLLTDEDVALEAIKRGIIPLLLNQVEVGSDRQQDLSAGTLVDILPHDSRAVPAEVIVFLTSRLRRADEKQTLLAARCLGSIAMTEDMQGLVQEQRVCESLVELLRRGSEKEKVAAADALYWCLFNEAMCDMAAGAGVIPLALELLQVNLLETKRSAAWVLQRLAKHSEACANEVISAGGAGKLVELLRMGDDTFQESVLTTLGDLACSYENQQAVVAAGAIGPVIECLGSDAAYVACATFSKLAQGNEAISSAIVAAGVLGPLVALVRETGDATCINAAEVLNALAQVESLVPDIINADAVAALTILTESDDDDQNTIGAQVLRRLEQTASTSKTGDDADSDHEDDTGSDDGAVQPSDQSAVCCGEQSSILELIEALKSDSLETTYAALKWLYRKAKDPDLAREIKNSDGVRWILQRAVAVNATWGHWAYARGCLYCWQSLLTTEQKTALSTRDPTEDEVAELLESIASTNEERVIEALELVYWISKWPADTQLSFVAAAVQLLRRASVRVQEEATRALGCAAAKKVMALEAIKRDAVPLLLNRLEDGGERLLGETEKLLLRLAVFYDRIDATPRFIQFLTHKIRTGDPSQRVAAFDGLGCFAEHEPMRRLMEEQHTFELVVELIGEDAELLESLANTSYRQCSFPEALCRSGVVPLLLNLLQASAAGTRSNAMRTLSSLAVFMGADTRLVMFSAGAVQSLVESLHSSDEDFPKWALQTLGVLGGLSGAPQSIVDAGAIVPAVKLLRCGEDDVKGYACSLLRVIADDNEDIGQSIVAAGALLPLVALLREGNTENKLKAVRTLNVLARLGSLARDIIDAGAIAPLVALSKSSNDKLKAAAAQVVHRLGQASPSKPQVHEVRSCGEHSTIPELIEALKSESLETTFTALKWLFRKATEKDAAIAIKHADGYRWILNSAAAPNATWGHHAYAHRCLQRMFDGSVITAEEQSGLCVRNLTKEEAAELVQTLKSTSPKDDERAIEVLESVDAIQTWPEDSKLLLAVALVDLLRRASATVMEEATRVLGCLVSDNDEVAVAVAKHGVVPLLLNQLDVGSEREKQQCTGVLLHLAAHDSRVIQFFMRKLRTGDENQTVAAVGAIQSIAQKDATRGMQLEQRMCEPLVELVRSGSENEKAAAADTLYWCLFSDATCRMAVDAGLIPSVVELSQASSAYTKMYAMWVLRRLANSSETRSHDIIEAGGVRVLTELLDSTDDNAQSAAFTTLGYLACSRRNQLEMTAAGVIHAVIDCLRNGGESQKLHACSLLSKLAKDNDVICSELVEAGALTPLVALVRDGGDKTKLEAVQALHTMSQEKTIVLDIIKAGAIPPLLEITTKSDEKLKAFGVQTLRGLVHSDDKRAGTASADTDEIVKRARLRDEEVRGDSSSALEQPAQSKHETRTITTAGAVLDGCDTKGGHDTGGCGGHSSVAELVAGLRSESLETTYAALKWLYRKAENRNDALAIKTADGYPRIVNCTASTWDHWAYARGCLFRMCVKGVITRDELDGLRVRDPTSDEINLLLKVLTSTAANHEERVVEVLEKVKFILNWPEDAKCPVALAIIDALCRASVAVLEAGTRALRCLVSDDEEVALELIKVGVVPLLLNSLDTGTEPHRVNAATTLGLLAAYDDEAATPRVIQLLKKAISTGDAKQQVFAAQSIGYMAQNESTHSTLQEQRAYDSLVGLLARGGSAHQKATAAWSLSRFPFDEDVCQSVTGAGAVSSLLGLLQAPTANQKRSAMAVLHCLAKCSDTCAHDIVSAGGARTLVELLRSGDEEVESDACRSLRSLSRSRRNKHAMVAARVIDSVIECLRTGNEHQKAAACGVLKALAKDSDVISRSLVTAGALAPLVSLLRDHRVRYSAAKTLRVLARVESLVRDIVDAGAVPPLIDFAANGIDQLHRQLAADVLQSLTIFDEPDHRHAVAGPPPEKSRTITVPQVNVAHADDHHSTHKVGEVAAKDSSRQVVLCGERSSIPELIEALRSESLETTYSALKWLFRKAAADDDATTAIKNADGYRLILHCAGVPTATWDHWAYAYGCLVQMKVSAAITLDMVLGLEMRDPTKDKLDQLLEILKSTGPESEERVIEVLEKVCFVMSWPEDTKIPFALAVVDLLRRASIRQLGEATNTIRFLVSDDKDVALAASKHGVVSLLLNQLDIGSENQQHLSATALSRLAAYDSRAVTPLLIEMFTQVLRSEDEKQKAVAVNLLGSITQNVATHRILVEHRIYEPLIDIVRIGSEGPREDRPMATNSVELLRRLASSDDATSELIAKAGGVAAIAPLVQAGTPEQKKHAAHVLYSLARRNTANRAELTKLQVVSPLVKMTRDGDDEQKTNATLALGSLMKTPAVRLEVKKLGGIDALKTLAKKGSPAQVEAARRAVRIGGGDNCSIS